MRFAWPALAFAVFPFVLSADPTHEEACAARLDASLAEMESRPLLKEEHATGLMWLRLDAEKALAKGDAETCHDKLDTVELLLGMAEIDSE